MSSPGHEDAPRFQVHWAEHPRMKWMLDALTTMVRKNRRLVIVVMSATFLGGVVTLSPKVKNSIIQTFERGSKSAELQGRALNDTTQPSIEKVRSWIRGLSRKID